MGEAEIKCAFVLVEEHFGALVAQVSDQLLKNGRCTLRMLFSQCPDLSPFHVRSALRILLHHQFVHVQANSNDQLEYELLKDKILCLNRFARFTQIGKILNEQFGDLIVEEILKNGQLTVSELVQLVINHFLNGTRSSLELSESVLCGLPKKIYTCICESIQLKCIQRSKCTILNASKEKDAHVIEDSWTERPPEIDLKLINFSKNNEIENAEPSAKRVKLENGEASNVKKQPDEEIYWCLNYDYFNRQLCDLFARKAILAYYEDERASELARIMFSLNRISNIYQYKSSLISMDEIVTEALKSDKYFQNEQEVKNFMQLFAVDNKFIRKCEDTSDGGKYRIDTAYSIEELTKSCVTSMIKDIYGAKTARMFRLLLIKKYLQQKQLGEDAMLSSKDSKERSYLLYRHGLIKLMQYCKTPDYAPLKTCFVFTVDLKEVVNTLLERCYHTVHAMHCKRASELHLNHALLEKKRLVDAIIENLGEHNQEDIEDQIEELNQSFTSHEKEQLNKLDNLTSKTRMAEAQVDDTMLLLQSWLNLKDS